MILFWLKKTCGLFGQIVHSLSQVETAPAARKHLPRLSQHIISQLVCLGRHTLTNLLTTGGKQFADWTADYRLYSQERVDCEDVLVQARKEIQVLNAAEKRLITAIDDSLLPKTGKKIPGVKYARDPMGPPFQVNFVRGQRVIQMSAAVIEEGQARMIPVMFNDASTLAKPGKKATEAELANYKEQSKARRLSVRGIECLHDMRRQMESDWQLWVAVDGSYTNNIVLNDLPAKTVLIGRIRSDAKLFYLPDRPGGRGAGRRRVYGDPAPTPEEIRTDENIPWQIVQAYASGKVHEFKVKTLKYLRWRGSGQKQTLQIMVIAPLRYRLSQSSKLLYHDPAYLICTDPDLPAETILQTYIWRWGIETNFRDEKSLLGTGQAQVRNPASVKAVPKMMVAAYSLLLLAGIKQFGIKGLPPLENIPKWQDQSKKRGTSANDLVKLLRLELWGDSIASNNKNDFVQKANSQRSHFNIRVPAFSSVLQVNTN
jgi:hypothetical protein